jgi:hypothetical protein
MGYRYLKTAVPWTRYLAALFQAEIRMFLAVLVDTYVTLKTARIEIFMEMNLRRRVL